MDIAFKVVAGTLSKSTNAYWYCESANWFPWNICTMQHQFFPALFSGNRTELNALAFKSVQPSAT